MPEFILELGVEEFPARFLAGVEKDLRERFKAALSEANLEHAEIQTYSTPRRQVVFIPQLAERSEVREEVVLGPSVKAAFDVGGRPTRAAEGFVRGHNVSLDDTFTVENEKGAYIAVRKITGGEDAVSILSSICPTIISALSFPKKMRWGSGDFSFGRPLRWILALLDDQIVPFAVDEHSAGNMTYGHRVHGLGPFIVASASSYFSVLEKEGHVTLETKKRRSEIIEKGDALAAVKNGTVLWKDSLLDEVQGLCEHPIPLMGAFDPSFLEIPREVLLTSMESHQKSFGIEKEGQLLPYFLTVLNITPENFDLVRTGWERVLRARLEDARFFWETDLNSSFDNWLSQLETVIFLAPLGSMGQKAARIAQLCGWLVDNIQSVQQGETIDKTLAMQAGYLAKADLVSAMVKEFDTLQGIMGGIYAQKFGESQEVASGIAEHYLPTGPDSPVPASLYGAIVSLADKADTLAGCFGLGMIPTGTADPYALRRAALGIIRIMEEKGLRFDIRELFDQALQAYGSRKWKLEPDQALLRLEEFFLLRLKNHFIGKGYETLQVEAVLQADILDVYAIKARLESLRAYSKTSGYETFVFCYKRMANILRKQQQEGSLLLNGIYDPSLFAEPAERTLAETYEQLLPSFETYWKADQFVDIYMLLDGFTPVVATFFDEVMVICDDLKIRENRMQLLQAIVNCFGRLADFNALQL